MDHYRFILKEVTDMFESCGCDTDVTVSASGGVRLVIRGPVSMCPSSIFHDHLERAKELMQSSCPEVPFSVDIEESESV